MIRHEIIRKHVNEFKVDRDLNFREDYDLSSLEPSVISAGRILDPVHFETETDRVLRGNRRILVAQKLYNDPNSSEELRKGLEYIDAIPYSDLSEQQRQELVLDHGDQKTLTRAEVIRAVWRLARMMYNEKSIGLLLYHRLADFTGSVAKAGQASRITDVREREKFVFTWLHGTLGNYLLYAVRLGAFVQEQVLLSETRKERKLSDEEDKRFVMETSRDRIKELNTAKNEDEKDGKWDSAMGGPKFNALIVKFKQEDVDKKAGRAVASTKTKYSADDMKKVADTMQSPMRYAFLQCAGELSDTEKSKVLSADAEFFRVQTIFALLFSEMERITDPNVRALVASIVRPENTEAQVKEALARLHEATEQAKAQLAEITKARDEAQTAFATADTRLAEMVKQRDEALNGKGRKSSKAGV